MHQDVAPETRPTAYALHGAFTAPEEHRAAFDSLPQVVAELCRTVQGLLIHDFYGLQLYGDPPAKLQFASRETLPISERIGDILKARDEPLATPRPPFERAVGTCRDFALMLCAMLRQQGVPARVRCGFAKYFHPPSYEDHWVCEYWKADPGQWALADAQLDAAHRAHLGIDFDPADVPGDRFMFSWYAWRMYRSDAADPAQFGHGDTTGPWFIQVNLARDLLALGKREISPWDAWRDAHGADRILTDEAMSLCDQIAALAADAGGLRPPQLEAPRVQEFLATPSLQRE